MLTLTKIELIEMVYRPQGDVPAEFVTTVANTVPNTDLCEMATKSMGIRTEYIGAGLFIML
jgi:hypothetical protein